MSPIAYFITFSTYACHLPGDSRGWVSPARNIYGTPQEPPDPVCKNSFLSQGIKPYTLDTDTQRVLVLESLLKTCQLRSWQAIAMHVRQNHVHCLLKATGLPEQIMVSLKAHATRCLKEYHLRNGQIMPPKFWASHGSTRYIWKPEELEPLTHYIYHEQGTPMARFCLNPDPHDASRNTHGW